MVKKKKEDELETLVEAPRKSEQKSAIDGVLVQETQYKNNPMLVLKKNIDDKYPLQFGLTKAKMIMDNIRAIEEFLNKHGR